MRHHLYSTEQLWELGWNTHIHTHTETTHINALFAKAGTLTRIDTKKKGGDK